MSNENENEHMDEEEMGVRVIAWCSLVALLQKINWLTNNAGPEIAGKLETTRKILYRWAGEGPMMKDFGGHYKDTIAVLEQLDQADPKSHLTVVRNPSEDS